MIKIRKMVVADLEAVMEVEFKSFTIPWTLDAFHNELIKNQFAEYTVLLDDEKIIGYCGVWIIIDEAHITNIAILPEYRGQGLGEKLLISVMNLCASGGALTVTLEVRVSNTPAKSLYRKLGFKDGGIRKNYYSDNLEDALVMWAKLG
jgi:ribosomal-protein-alanine N-acetyltransferase